MYKLINVPQRSHPISPITTAPNHPVPSPLDTGPTRPNSPNTLNKPLRHAFLLCTATLAAAQPYANMWVPIPLSAIELISIQLILQHHHHHETNMHTFE